jgi:YD repeat-containing protein
MKKIICLLSFVLVSLASCSHDDDAGIVNMNPNEVLLQKTLTRSYSSSSSDDVNGLMTTLWFYNGKKLNYTQTSRGVRTNYFYTGDLITRIEENGVESTYEYDDSDRLISISVDGHPSANYTYNPDGTVTIVQHNETKTLYFTAGEIKKVVTNYEADSFSTTHEYSYDDKFSPTKNIIGFDKIYVNLNHLNGCFRNVTSRSYIDSDGIDGLVIKTLTYNAIGFPTTAQSRDNHLVDSYDMQFFYE